MATAVVEPPIERKAWLDRALSVMAEVRAHEGVTALLLTANLFLLLTAYYIIKPVREALILSGGGAEFKSYTSGFQAVLLLALVPAYGAVASRVSRIKLINGVFLFFASNLVIFYFLSRLRVPLYLAFFVWVSIFNVMVVAQLWSFANDLYTPEQGKRLFPIVGVGASVGGVAGSAIAALLIKPLGIYQLMLASAGILMLCLLLSNVIHRREKARLHDVARQRQVEEPLAHDGGFRLIFRQRYLLYIALLILILNVVNTDGEYMRDRIFTQAARQAAANGATGGLSETNLLGTYSADFQFWQNLLGLLIQFFLVSRVFRYLGVRGSLLVLPCIALCTYSLIAASPIFAFIWVGKVLENSTDYSLMNTVRGALYLPTSREAKYKAKQAVDTFCVRFGDVMSSLVVFTGAGLLGVGLRTMAAFNIVAVAVWLLLAAGVIREHRELTAGQGVEAA
jgi:AAA family ATP:ADP antiporter